MKKTAALFSILLTALLNAQTGTDEKVLERLRHQEKKDRVYDQILSNVETFNVYLQKSNEVRVALMDTNTALIGAVLSEPDFFGNDLVRRSDFLNLAAEHYFYRVDSAPSPYAKPAGLDPRKKAFDLWQEIIEMDLKLLAAAKAESWEGRGTPISPNALSPALAMDRYRYEITPDKAAAPFRNNYARYFTYYTNGYDAGSEFRLNMGVYFLLKGELSNAEKALTFLEDKSEHYADRLLAEKAVQTTNDAESYRTVKDYLVQLRSREFYLKRVEEKYFEYANALLTTRDEQGRIRPLSFTNIPVENRDSIRRALEAYDKATTGAKPKTESYLNAALVYLRMERYPNALIALDEALKRSPSFPVLYTLGLTQLRLGDYPKAYQYFIEAKYHDEKMPELFNNLAHCTLFLTNRDERKRGLGWANRAIELNDKNHYFYVTKGEVLRNLNDASGYTNQLRNALTVLQNVQVTNYNDYRKVFLLETTNEVPRRIREAIRDVNERLGIGPFKER